MMKRDGSTEAGVSMEHDRNGGSSALKMPVDPEVPAKAKRRRFTAEYKLRVLEEAEAIGRFWSRRGHIATAAE